MAAARGAGCDDDDAAPASLGLGGVGAEDEEEGTGDEDEDVVDGEEEGPEDGATGATLDDDAAVTTEALGLDLVKPV